VDSHRNQFVGIGMRITHALQFLNELRRNSVDAEGDQLLEVDVIIAKLLQLAIHSGVAP
jgi:hypothetical protein